MNILSKTSRKVVFLLVLLLGQLGWVSCLKEPAIKNYYTFSGETVASYLQKGDEYTQFVKVLDRAKMFDLLSTYGQYTCLAPNNAAIDTFLMERNLTSVDQLSLAECDTLARTHLINGAFYTTDLEDGAIPSPNFLDRYLIFSSDSAFHNGQVQLGSFINKVSEMVVLNDSVENGVVHTLSKVVTPSSLFLPKLMEEDTTISIFVAAMKLTGFHTKLESYIDERYHVGLDSTNLRLKYYTGGTNRDADYPAKRKFYFTAFVEKNAVYHSKGIHSVNDLITKLMNRSFDLFGTVTYDNNYTDSTNALYRYVAYHFLDRLGNYDDWTTTSKIRANQAVYDHLDPQDFYETMCPSTIMKFQSTREGQLYINRRRINEGALADRTATDLYEAAVPGVRVYQPSESGKVDQSALNGVFHYIDDLLLYNTTTARNVLNTRMRMDATTLSPDFMNNVGRERNKPNINSQVVTLYKPGFVKNFIFNDQTKVGVRCDPDWSPSYQCGAIDILGQYDFSVKIPPVPEGQYEIRFGMNMGNDRGVVQIYFDNQASGIPIDMRISKYDNPRIGAAQDGNDVEVNQRNDKDMKNRGFMKGMDSWFTGAGKTDTHRNFWNSVRVVVATLTIREGETHYIRFKNVIDNPAGLFPFDYLEICPKSVYDSPEGEDSH